MIGTVLLVASPTFNAGLHASDALSLQRVLAVVTHMAAVTMPTVMDHLT